MLLGGVYINKILDMLGISDITDITNPSGRSRNIRAVTLTAVLISLTIAGNSFVKIPIIPGMLEIRFGFVFFSIIAFLFGPVVAFAAGIIENTISFFMNPGGSIFDIRYGLNAGLAGILYAIFLYRKNYKSDYFIIWITAAKASVNFICNVVITGFLLKEYFGESYRILTAVRLAKNIGMLPIEILIMFFVLKAVLKAAMNLGILKPQITTKASNTGNTGNTGKE